MVNVIVSLPFQLPEIITFLYFLVVFILGYGIASQALINPYRPFSFDSVRTFLYNTVMLPYWQMYGELSLDE